ncbi:hypothetical protein E2I00_009632, partial [Balaenoptera physalus]
RSSLVWGREERRALRRGPQHARLLAAKTDEWVTIANNLLLQCHIHLRIRELEDCDANVFIALYQSVLGEKVPDLIAIPRSQEDEAHNVQAVIDSLALDYLQVKLDRVLKNPIEETLWKSEKVLKNPDHPGKEFLLRGAQGPNEMQSKKASTLPCSDSHEEVLNTPSSSFLSKSGTSFVEDTEIPSVAMIPNARKLGEPIRSAIPLHPPYHPSEPRAPCPIGKEYLRSSHCSHTMNSTGEGTAFSVEPDNRVFLTSKLSKDGKQEMYPVQVQGPRTRKLRKGKRYENRAAVSSWDSPFSQRAGKRLTEQELHAMLKSALGDRIKEKTGFEEEDIGNEEVESGNDETLSQHSDSIVEYGPKKQRPGTYLRPG